MVVGFMGLLFYWRFGFGSLLEIDFAGDPYFCDCWFCSHLKIAMRFACLLLRKCKKRNKNIDFLNYWERFARKKINNAKNTCFYSGQGLNMIF